MGEAVAALAWGTRNKQKKLDVSMWTGNPGAERQRHGDPRSHWPVVLGL